MPTGTVAALVLNSVPTPPPPPPLPSPPVSGIGSLRSISSIRSRPSTVTRSISSGSSDSTSTLTSDVPPTPTTPGVEAFNDSFESLSDKEMLHAELRMRLSRKPGLNIPRTPDVPLGPGASKEEVAAWLKIKGFNDVVVKRLVGLEGKTLLALKKSDVQRLLSGHVDNKEIWRLDSQIKRQRANNPFNTGRTSEFRAVLARARRKAEEDLPEHDSERVGISTC